MENALYIRTEASHSLNFLVYIQNLYLNQSLSRDDLKFPHIPTKCVFRKDFDVCFNGLWDEVSKKIWEDPLYDLKLFAEEKTFYQGLFIDNEATLYEFREIYQSFLVWWSSIAGHFSIERSIDEKVQETYAELTNLLNKKGINPRKELFISLIYDECLLADFEPYSYFTILSTRDFFMHCKELISKLETSIY
ncbi:hypothetical protein [Sporosarcina sp. A2]|uniref:hypothetical protein n=1 Tax=Sporosarcina sp. A2 TaxID=3393449 RepID=UPI003D799966